MGQDQSSTIKPRADKFMNSPHMKHSPPKSPSNRSPSPKKVSFQKGVTPPHSPEQAAAKSDKKIVAQLLGINQGNVEPLKKHLVQQDQDSNPDNKIVAQLLGVVNQGNVENLKKHLLAQQNQDVTFNPTTHVQSSGPHRTVEEFYADQQRFLEQKQQKIEANRSLKNKQERAAYTTVQVNPKSQELAKQQTNDVYTRTTAKRKQIDERLASQRQTPKHKKPQLSASERKSVQQRLQEVPQRPSREYPSTTSESKHKPELIESQLTKRYNKILDELEPQNIDLPLMKDIMMRMAYIHSEEADISDVWIFLHKDQAGMVERQQALELILAIEGTVPTTFEPTFSTEQVSNIRRLQYASNRLHNPPTREVSEWQEETTKSSFMPKTTNAKYKEEIQRSVQIQQATVDAQTTSDLADKFRAKVLDEYKSSKTDAGELSHEQYLHFIKQSQNMKHSDQYRARDEDLKECTFKPKTLNKAMTNSKTTPTTNVGPMQRSVLLNSIRHTHPLPRNPDLVEYEKSKHECTFTPNIHAAPSDGGSTVSNIRSVEESVQRVRKAWEIRQNINNYKARGETHHQSPNKLNYPNESNYSEQSSGNKSSAKKTLASQRQKSSHSLQPLLFVDVNLGSRVERIPIHEGDNLEQVALTFIGKHNLDYSIAPTLQQMLQTQVDVMYQKHLF